MGKLITVVGNSGVGKTTITRLLSSWMPLSVGLEGHEDRPFQFSFAQNHHKYAFANQIDYLMMRAEQECYLRSSDRHGIQDGGLDLDYYVFTRYFYQQGYLNESEYTLCQRTYQLLRQLLGPPEILIYLQAPPDVLLRRFNGRGRKLEIAQADDLQAMAGLLDEWLSYPNLPRIIQVDASMNDPEYTHIRASLIAQLTTVLG
jgi:deoxyadenosine/deoxycytidine kinase